MIDSRKLMAELRGAIPGLREVSVKTPAGLGDPIVVTFHGAEERHRARLSEAVRRQMSGYAIRIEVAS